MLFTIGYEGSDIDGFVRCLLDTGIRELIDIRELPLSRKSGFAKTALSLALSTAGIKYSHLRGLGSPREARRELRRCGDWTAFVSTYTDHLFTVSDEAEIVARRASHHNVAVMCFEANPRRCHRSLLADDLLRRGLIGSVSHLNVKESLVAR